MALLPWLLLPILAGAFAYALLVIIAAQDYRRQRPPALVRPVPISILKPLAGLDDGLEENLASFFGQDYPEFELVFAVRYRDDPAVGVVRRLRHRFPHVAASLVVTGDPPYANAKVYALEQMLAAARHDLLVMADSDTRVRPDLLREVAAEFQHDRLGLTTCPYRAMPGPDLWSRLEAAGMNTSFIAGILAARFVEGMRFGVGPSMVVRRIVIEDIGGFARLKDYLAEDFMLGRLAAEAGWRTGLSSYVVEHHIGRQHLRSNFQHRLRWARSTRRSRPFGYFGQLFTYPLPIALLIYAVRPRWWPVALLTVAVHAAGVWATAGRVLKARWTLRRWWLVGLEDLLSFAFWIAGFFGNTVSWRGHRYSLKRDGTFEPAARLGPTVEAGEDPVGG